MLRNRPLFAGLSDEDITFLAESFKDCRHPQVALGQVVHIAESRRSPRRLQDHDSLAPSSQQGRTAPTPRFTCLFDGCPPLIFRPKTYETCHVPPFTGGPAQPGASGGIK